MKDDKLIVGVFGTQCTGKSTLINDIVANTAGRDDINMRWMVFGDNYRDIITQKGLKINRDGTEECQKVIHEILLGNIQKAVDENVRRRLIMDRTIIDSFAYTFWHFAYGKSGTVSKETIENMWNQVSRYSRMFNALVYIPLDMCSDVVVVDDKFRDTNAEYRKQIDRIMKSIWFSLSDGGCRMMSIFGSREDRVKMFLNGCEHQLENDYIGKFTSIGEFSARFVTS